MHLPTITNHKKWNKCNFNCSKVYHGTKAIYLGRNSRGWLALDLLDWFCSSVSSFYITIFGPFCPLRIFLWTSKRAFPLGCFCESKNQESPSFINLENYMFNHAKLIGNMFSSFPFLLNPTNTDESSWMCCLDSVCYFAKKKNNNIYK